MNQKAARALNGQVALSKEKIDRIYPWLYAMVMAVAELLVTVKPWYGIVLHTLILICLLISSAVAYGQPRSKLYTALTLGPLIRILSLSLPLAHLPRIYWYAAVSFPLLAGAFVIARINNYSPGNAGLRYGNWRKNTLLHILTLLSGIPLGIAEYFILRPEPIFKTFDPVAFIPPGLIFLICTGFTEEVIFRGIMFKAAADYLSSKNSIFLTGFVFAALHITHLSFIDVVFVFAIAVYFALIVKRTGSIFGVAMAHGIININLYLIWPYFF